MNHNASAAILAVLFAAAPAFSDVIITTSYTTDGRSSDTTIYGNGKRIRYDYGKGLILIRQCDLNRFVQIDDKAKTYLSLPAEQSNSAVSSPGAPPSTKVDVTDTKERKEIFGYTARHLKISEAEEGKRERTETDGWYIDLKDLVSCNRQELDSAAGRYPVSYLITTYGENGKPASTVSMRVTTLVTSPLDPTLFEVPRGYTETATPNTELKVAQKATTAIRIGTAPLQNKSNQKVQANAPYNQLFAQLFAAQLDVIPLPDGPAEAVQKKAREAQCDYILYNELAAAEKPASGKVGSFLHKAPGIGHITGGDALEARVDYRLVPTNGGDPVLASSITGKTGSSFDWKSAALLASNVLPMTMAARMLGGAFNPAMMNSLLNGHGSGASITSMDPMMGSLTMFLRATNVVPGASGDPSQNAPGLDAALAAAFDQEGKAIVAQLKPASK
jgi:hypothetical protein